MAFDKIILGEEELSDFEDLFIRDGIIERMHPDLFAPDEIVTPKKTRNNNRKRLLLSIMLFDKFDAVNLTRYDMLPLIDCGLIEEDSCLISGTDNIHPTSVIIDSVWKYKRKLIAAVYKITEKIFEKNGIDAYPKSLIKDEEALNLCDAYLFGTQRDFLNEYEAVIRLMVNNWFKKIYFDIIYAYPVLDYEQEEALDQILLSAQENIDKIYGYLNSISKEEDTLQRYLCLCEELESNRQIHSVPSPCFSCTNDWNICNNNSEFIYNCTFDCPNREYLGVRRYAKFNGLVLSGETNAILFDNSIGFRGKRNTSLGLTEDIYHIVNVDLSMQVESLPVPQNAKEAIRLRNRPEIISFRNILNKWGECLQNGEINESEYILKDFEAARKFFENKEMSNRKKRSIFHCFFEALGNQIPYLSNVAGVISPFVSRKKILDEEKHRWFLLTR